MGDCLPTPAACDLYIQTVDLTNHSLLKFGFNGYVDAAYTQIQQFTEPMTVAQDVDHILEYQYQSFPSAHAWMYLDGVLILDGPTGISLAGWPTYGMDMVWLANGGNGAAPIFSRGPITVDDDPDTTSPPGVFTMATHFPDGTISGHEGYLHDRYELDLDGHIVNAREVSILPTWSAWENDNDVGGVKAAGRWKYAFYFQYHRTGSHSFAYLGGLSTWVTPGVNPQGVTDIYIPCNFELRGTQGIDNINKLEFCIDTYLNYGTTFSSPVTVTQDVDHLLELFYLQDKARLFLDGVLIVEKAVNVQLINDHVVADSLIQQYGPTGSTGNPTFSRGPITVDDRFWRPDIKAGGIR